MAEDKQPSYAQMLAELEALKGDMGTVGGNKLVEIMFSMMLVIREARTRAQATDRDLGFVAERVAAVERRLDSLTTDLRSAEQAIGELHKEREDPTGAIADRGATVTSTDGLAVHTLHIEHLHIGENLDATGAQLGEDPDRMVFGVDHLERRARARPDVGPITPGRVSAASGEELDAIADRLGLARKEYGGRGFVQGKFLAPEIEADHELRLRCGAALFGQGMTIEGAEMLAREAAIGASNEPSAPSYLKAAREPAWRPHAWVVNAILAAAGVNRTTWQTETEIGSKDRHELAAAHSKIAELRAELTALRERCNADVEAISRDATAALRLAARPLGWSTAAPITGDTLRQAIDCVVRERDQARSDLAQIKARAGALSVELETWMGGLAQKLACVNDQHVITDRLESLLGEFVACRKRAETAQAQLDKFMSACADQTIQIMELRGQIRMLGGNPIDGPQRRDAPEQAEPLSGL